MFLGIDKIRDLGTEFGVRNFESETLGKYGISEIALILIKDYRRRNKIDEEKTTQGLVNIAYEILRGKNQNLFPVVLDSKSYNSFKESQSSEGLIQNQILFTINTEECLEQKVDHTLKAQKLLEISSEKLEHTHAFDFFSPSLKDMVLAQIAGIEEYQEILNHLCDEKFLAASASNGFNMAMVSKEKAFLDCKYKFKVQGWHHLQKEREKTNTNKVFIATAFNWPEEEPLRGEVINAIKRACRRLGWEADIVSQGHTGYITDRIMSEIKQSRFVIAELTYHNRGVYFESGYARGLGKDVFHIVREGFNRTDLEADKESRKLHFDIQQIQYRIWINPEEVETKIYEWVNSTIGEFK